MTSVNICGFKDSFDNNTTDNSYRLEDYSELINVTNNSPVSTYWNSRLGSGILKAGVK